MNSDASKSGKMIEGKTIATGKTKNFPKPYFKSAILSGNTYEVGEQAGEQSDMKKEKS